MVVVLVVCFVITSIEAGSGGQMTGSETDAASTNASTNKGGTETDGVTASTDGGETESRTSPKISSSSIKTGASTNAGDDGSKDYSEPELRTAGSDATAGATSIDTAKVGGMYRFYVLTCQTEQNCMPLN